MYRPKLPTKFLSLNHKAREAHVEKEIPTPKSWANLKADGTAKGGKTAKPKASGRKKTGKKKGS